MGMPVTNHTIVVTIDGTDRSGLLLKDSLFVRSSVGNGSDVAEMALRDGSGAFTPADWDEVTIEVNGTRIFGGYIIQRQGAGLGAGTAKRAAWQISCKDWSILLDRVLVSMQHTQASDRTILGELFSTYLAGEGFDATTNVAVVRDDIDISFEEVTLREALNQLAVQAGAAWHIAPDKALYWYSPATPAAAAFGISQTPNGTTTFGALEDTVTRSVDATQIVNRVRVIGSESASTTKQTDQWTASGAATFGPLTKKPHSLWLVTYVVDLGGTPTNVSAYASQIGLESDGDKLVTEGGTFTVVANLETRTLRITDVGNLKPKAGTLVKVQYYYSTPVETVRDSAASQTAFGRVFETSVYDESLSSVLEAQAYADRVLDEYAFGRETISFDVARHGLLPGRLISVVNTTLGLSGSWLIQEVQFAATVTGPDQFMVVCSVSAGKATRTLIESLLPMYSAGAGRAPAPAMPGRIAKIAADLGDVVAGRLIMTDGGTARFAWGTPNAATGAVMGLEDNAGNAYGALYIYDGGTVRAKLGRMTGLPDVGSVTPTGWGLYTTNGYFSGKVVGSYIEGGTISGVQLVGQTINGAQITGGTVTGAQLTGGTVTGGLLTGGTVITNIGTIAGFTLAQNHLWSNGGTISTGSVVNSSNPGVWLSADGLFGFGTLGMTFGIWTDPAKGPLFTSGTIRQAVYEVYEASVMRTNEDVFADGGIQLDGSGLFGVDPINGFGRLLLENGDKLLLEDGRGIELHGQNFSLDTMTGRLTAENATIYGAIYANEGRFTGTVSASQIIGGTITGVTIAGQTITGNDVIGGTITGVAFTGGNISQGTIAAAVVSGGTISGAVFTGGNISQGTISAAVVSGGTVSGALVSGGTVSGALVSGGTFSGGTVSGGTISAAVFTGGTVSGALVSGGTVSVAGGSVTLTGTGINFAAASGTAPSISHVKWVQGGTVVASYVGGFTIGQPWVQEDAGVYGSMAASKITYVWGASTASYSYLNQTPSAFILYTKEYGAVFESAANYAIIPTIRPRDTTSTLGHTDKAWRYLYLSDGTDEWRVAVNTSGVLTTTKV